MKKRILSLVLAVCLALSLAPAAFAANIVDSGTCGADADGSNIAWTLDADGNLTVTGAGLLQKKAFQNRKDIVTVKFVCTDDRDAMSINILDYAFAGCTNLRSIDFGSRDARNLHAHAFEDCTSLTDIHFGNDFGMINAYAFRGCTSLRQVTFPYTVFQVSKYAFADCTALTEVTFEPDPDGMRGLSTLGSHAFAGCTSLRAVNVPERLNRIDSYAFSGCSSLEWLPIEQFDVLEAHSFAGWTGLTNAVLSPSLQELPDGLFDGCTGLQRVTIQDRVTDIGTGVFSGCTALTDVYYTGAQTQWNRIRTPENENVLGSAALHCGAVAHTFDNNWVETLAPTCTDDGLTSRTCTDPGCGRTQTRIVPSLGHDWDDGVTRIEPDGLLAGVDGGRYDSMANGVEITEERAQKYDFSDPYCYIRTAIIVKSDDDSINSFEDLNGKTTANTISSTYATLAESYGAKTTGVDDLNQTIELLLNGRVDATLNAEVTYFDYLKEHPDANIKIAALTNDASQVAFPVRKGDETATLREALNQAINELREDGTIAEISEKYFGTDLSQAPSAN